MSDQSTPVGQSATSLRVAATHAVRTAAGFQSQLPREVDDALGQLLEALKAPIDVSREPEATAASLIKDVVFSCVEDKLDWNVRAYGKAWTGEGEDTEFIVGGVGERAIERLRECGLEIGRVNV